MVILNPIKLTIYINPREELQLLLNYYLSRAVLAHAFNPSTGEAEADESVCVRGQPGLHDKSQPSQGYRGDPICKKITTKTKQKKHEDVSTLNHQTSLRV